MSYTLKISTSAKKDLKNLDDVTKRRIIKKLKFYIAQDNPLSFAKRLTDYRDGDYRWRIGHYRVVFDVIVQGSSSTILLLRVQHRSQVYKA